MNENVKKWVQALESGEYEQGRSYLRHGNNFCCLGVACDLYLKDGGKLYTEEGREVEPKPIAPNDKIWRYGRGSTAMLPPEVMEYLGVRDNTGGYGDGHGLAQKNDGGASFEVIARIIRSEPPGLFKN